LLHRILPEPIVTRVHAGESTIADRFEAVTVLFSDLVGFTKVSAGLTPHQLVDNLNDLFSGFDALAAELGVEKIKTIGDAYMAMAGAPTLRPDRVAAVADMAFGMQEVLARFNENHDPPFSIRIGLHTGAIAAGIIGKHRFLYDIWGDTVNTASRIESYSEPGRVHVSAEVAAVLAPDFELESRGIMDIRGKGEVETFFLNGRKLRHDSA
jgi:class 3 adenylate cyclase